MDDNKQHHKLAGDRHKDFSSHSTREQLHNGIPLRVFVVLEIDTHADDPIFLASIQPAKEGSVGLTEKTFEPVAEAPAIPYNCP